MCKCKVGNFFVVLFGFFHQFLRSLRVDPFPEMYHQRRVKRLLRCVCVITAEILHGWVLSYLVHCLAVCQAQFPLYVRTPKASRFALPPDRWLPRTSLNTVSLSSPMALISLIVPTNCPSLILHRMGYRVYIDQELLFDTFYHPIYTAF